MRQAKHIALYVLIVAVWGASTYVVATAAVNSAVEEVATESYYNAMDSCIIGPAANYLPPWER